MWCGTVAMLYHNTVVFNFFLKVRVRVLDQTHSDTMLFERKKRVSYPSRKEYKEYIDFYKIKHDA